MSYVRELKGGASQYSPTSNNVQINENNPHSLQFLLETYVHQSEGPRAFTDHS